MSWSLIFSFLAGACVFISYFFQQKESEKDKQELIDKSDELRKLTEQHSNSIEGKAQEIINLSNQLSKANQQIIELTNELSLQVTGGKNKPVVEPTVFGQVHPNDIALDIYNFSTKYPLKNIGIHFVEMLEVPDLKSLSPDDRLNAVMRATKQFYFETILQSGAAMFFYRKSVPKEIDKVSYHVRVMWRNGSYSAQIEFERNSEGLFKAKIKYMDANGKEFTINHGTEK